MKKLARVMGLSLLLGTLVGGCASEPGSFRKCNMTNATVLGQSEGEATGIMLFNFIPIKQNHRFKDAYQDAISKLGGTCLADPVIHERWFWAWVLNGYTFRVNGTVVKEAM